MHQRPLHDKPHHYLQQVGNKAFLCTVVTVLVFSGVEVPLGNVPLTSFGSDKSNYVTADELASTWHKLGIDATDEEVENFIEVCLFYKYLRF